jgi:hypothetical protein
MAIARCINFIKMRLYRCWLDSGLVCIQVSNVLVQEWLPARFGDVGEDWGKVGCRLMRVGEGSMEGLRLIPKHACGSIWCVGLQMSVQVSSMGVVLLLLSACIGKRAWRSTGTSRRKSYQHPGRMAPMEHQEVWSP